MLVHMRTNEKMNNLKKKKMFGRFSYNYDKVFYKINCVVPFIFTLVGRVQKTAIQNFLFLLNSALSLSRLHFLMRLVMGKGRRKKRDSGVDPHSELGFFLNLIFVFYFLIILRVLTQFLSNFIDFL